MAWKASLHEHLKQMNTNISKYCEFFFIGNI